MIYLASPYSHPDSTIREQLFAACRAAAELMRAGHIVFSPVAQCHPIAQHGLPTDWSYWERVDRRFLEVCDEVVVLMLDGWRESVGVREIESAGELGKDERYASADDVLLASARSVESCLREDPLHVSGRNAPSAPSREQRT